MPRQSSKTTLANSTNQENNTMTNAIDNTNLANPTTNQENTNMNQTNVFAQAYDDRRAFEVRTTEVAQSKPSITMTKEKIKAASPYMFFASLFQKGQIRLTNVGDQTRKNGIPVVYSNPIQRDQLFRALAMVEHKIHNVWMAEKNDFSRTIFMMDPKGDHNRWLSEAVNSEGYVQYEIFYAHVAYNNFGQSIGFTRDGMHPMQQSISDRVRDYNLWVDFHNDAITSAARGLTLTTEQAATVEKARANTDMNLFVRDNSARHIKFESIINKYALEAWLLMANAAPAFELYSYARTQESTVKFLERMVVEGTRAYQNQLAVLAGVEMKQEVE